MLPFYYMMIYSSYIIFIPILLYYSFWQLLCRVCLFYRSYCYDLLFIAVNLFNFLDWVDLWFKCRWRRWANFGDVEQIGLILWCIILNEGVKVVIFFVRFLLWFRLFNFLKFFFLDFLFFSLFLIILMIILIE